MHRRTFIRRTAAFAGATAVMSIVPRKAFAAGTPTVVNSIRSLSNPYHATWNQGGAAFAKSVGAEYVTLVTEGNSEKGIADIRAIIQKTGGNMGSMSILTTHLATNGPPQMLARSQLG